MRGTRNATKFWADAAKHDVESEGFVSIEHHYSAFFGVHINDFLRMGKTENLQLLHTDKENKDVLMGNMLDRGSRGVRST